MLPMLIVRAPSEYELKNATIVKSVTDIGDQAVGFSDHIKHHGDNAVGYLIT